MRNATIAPFIIALFGLLLYSTGASGETAKDIKEFPTCQYCNMDRQTYAHSRMLIHYSDGSAFGACSIHCMALNLIIHIHNTPESIWVADYFSGELTDAETAYWVLGGDKPGVMTRRAKWAFGRKTDAEEFVSKNGGEIASFDEALKASYEDMYNDSKMIRVKKKIGKMSPY